nr:hypothetical protein [Tanacetum cinerariifolium]
MIVILEKSEHNIDFHQIVDFIEASHISQGEAFLTVSSLDAGQDRETINKTSALPHELTPRVTSLDADEGSMQQKLQELMELCTGLQRQQTQMDTKIKAQDLVISSLKARVKIFKDKDRGSVEPSGDDAPVNGRSMEIGQEVRVERSTELKSNDTEEMVNVLTSIEATNILTSRVTAVSVPPVAGDSTVGVPTVSGLFPTVNAIFTTASVVTPYSRHPRGISAKDKGKEKVVESEEPKKKKLQEQINAQVAREIEEEIAREDQRMNEQLHLQEYEQSEAELTIGEKIELINELKQFEDFVPMVLNKEGKRVKRKGLKLEQGSAKKMKTSEEGKKDYWKIIRLGGHTTVYQFFVDMLKQHDREDLHQLWALVKEILSIRQATKDKEIEL